MFPIRIYAGIFVFACTNVAAYYSNAVKTPFTIEEAVLGGLSVQSFSGKWISDSELEYQDKKTKDLRVFNVATNRTSIRLKGTVLDKYSSSKYSFSADGRFVLIPYNETTVFRHTKTAQYVVYEIPKGRYYDVSNAQVLQEASWGPKNNALIYVKDSNLYYIPNTNEAMTAIQLTTSGISGVVYNGITDWVYEEEVLASGKAFWFSPSGDQLVYLTLNDTNVRLAAMLEYGKPGAVKDQYMKVANIRYPKTGTDSPVYELWHVSLRDVSKRTLFAKSNENIFYDLKWANDKVFFFLDTNRVQNESMTHSCNAANPKTCVITFRHNNKIGWANTLLPAISKSMDRFLKLEGAPVKNLGNFNNLVLYYQNSTSTRLTDGYFDVQDVLHWDQKNKIVYYSAPQEFKATTLHVYAVSETPNERKSVCLTCQVKSPEGRVCSHVKASFSNQGTYMVVNCNGPDPKSVYLYKTEVPLGRPLRLLEENAKLREQLKLKLLPEVYNFTVKIVGLLNADVRLLLPPNMDKTGRTQYPMVLYVYAGPATKAIIDAFKLDWGLYLSTSQNIIYGFIDGRNTLNKGENMLFAGYRALGTVEIEDQMNVTRQIAQVFPFVDPDRIGVWGWSYGGYTTTKILEMDYSNIFRCGIAVAPVVDWLYYDSIYTERYMGLPEENKNGYERSSALKNVSNLRKKKFLLIHGNADDNVHYQNGMILAKVLELNDIPFELMSYPDENHSLLSVRKHLYHTMDSFWKRCFNLPQ